MPRNTILLKGKPLNDEANAGATVRPGALVEFDANNDVIENASAADTDAQIVYAVEHGDIGNEIGDDYLITERVLLIHPRRGDVFQAFVEDSITTVIGEPMESNGGGALQVQTTGRIVAFADEVVTTVGDTLVKVRAP